MNPERPVKPCGAEHPRAFTTALVGDRVRVLPARCGKPNGHNDAHEVVARWES